MIRSAQTRPHLRKALSQVRALARPAVLGLALTLGQVLPGQAQSFGPVIRVNDKVITGYELDQRARMLQVFNAPGNPQDLAREQLIEDRLKAGAADRFGLTADAEEVEAGMTEFAGRANMELPQFIQALSGEGVSQQTFRDFVASNVVWRQVVRGRFASRVSVTEEEIDRAIATRGQESGVQVLISEIFVPTARNPQQAAQVADQISQITTIDAFAQAARQYSAAPSRDQGGRVNWMSASNLPPALRPQIMALSPGQVTQPIEIDGALALFQLRAIQEASASRQEYSEIEYASYYIAGGRSEDALSTAAKIRAEIDTCDDLYGVAKGQPEDVLERVTLAPSEIPQDIGMELAKLDDNEVSTALTRNNGQALVFLMLCNRTPAGVPDEDEIDRNAVRTQLQNARLGSYAEGYLAQLRSEARIVE